MFFVTHILQTTLAPPAQVLPMAPPLLEHSSPVVPLDEPQPGPSGLQRPLVLVRTYCNINLCRERSFLHICVLCHILPHMIGSCYGGILLSPTPSFLRRPGRMRGVCQSLLCWRLPKEGSHLPLLPTSRLTNGLDWTILHHWLALWIHLGYAFYTCHSLSFFCATLSLHSFSLGCFLLMSPFCCYWMLLLYLQEDLPYPEELGGLGSLLDEALPIDCVTPSSSRLTHLPPSSLLGSNFGRKSDVFCISSPSVSPSVTAQGPTIVTLDDSDDQAPPFDLSKHAPIHKRAGKKLQQLIAEYPAAPLPLPVQKYDSHTPMSMYYGGHLVHYQLYDSLPLLLVYHLYKPLPLPVDQNLVRVAKDGADLIFYINVHVSELSDLFRPYIWAGSLQFPQIKKPADPASSLAFRQFMAHEEVRRHTSLTPASNSQKQWVESNRSLLADMKDLMAEVQKDDQHCLPIVHVDIVSSNTGVSQYLEAPLIPWNTTQRSPSDLRSLLKPAVGQSVLSSEREARSAAYLFWVIVQPVPLSSELNEIMQNTVVALKREGKQTFSSLAAGQQGAIQFALKPLQNMFSNAPARARPFRDPPPSPRPPCQSSTPW